MVPTLFQTGMSLISWRLPAIAFAGVMLIAPGGCSVAQLPLVSDLAAFVNGHDEESAESLAPKDFYAATPEARAELTPGPPPQLVMEPGNAGEASDDFTSGSIEITEFTSDNSNTAMALTGPQNIGSVEPKAAQEFLIVDGLVGHVNGSPIFVEEFFRPVANRLEIWGDTLTYRDFVAQTYTLIKQRLSQLMQNKLIISEAQGTLTEREQAGLLYFLKTVEKSMTDRAGKGSRASAEIQMREQTGVGIDEQIEIARNQQLIYKIRAEIEKRVNVTWRDIRKYYRDHEEEFNPPASIQLRLILASSTNTKKVQAINEALAEGRPFEAVARDHSSVWSSIGGLMKATPINGTLQDTPLTDFPLVNAAVLDLDEGEYAGPIHVEGDRSIWIYVESYQGGQGRTLYDAQHDIEDLLYKQRFDKEQTKYLEELLSRGSMDDFDQMAFGLMKVALFRWAPPEPTKEDQ